MDISQKGDGVVPIVLVHFRDTFEAGQLFGPYRSYLYYWRTHDTAVIASTLALLWPWLSLEKRAQADKTLAVVPALFSTQLCGEIWAGFVTPGDDERHAWAAGFFEGDGTIGAYGRRGTKSSPKQLSMSIAQASLEGVPTSLLRFREIVDVGAIRGPIAPQGWSRLPQYRWEAHGRHAASAVGPLLPWLVGPKRQQVLAALAAADQHQNGLADTPTDTRVP